MRARSPAAVEPGWASIEALEGRLRAGNFVDAAMLVSALPEEDTNTCCSPAPAKAPCVCGKGP